MRLACSATVAPSHSPTDCLVQLLTAVAHHCGAPQEDKREANNKVSRQIMKPTHVTQRALRARNALSHARHAFARCAFACALRNKRSLLHCKASPTPVPMVPLRTCSLHAAFPLPKRLTFLPATSACTEQRQRTVNHVLYQSCWPSCAAGAAGCCAAAGTYSLPVSCLVN